MARLSLHSGLKSDTPWSGKFAEITSDSQDTTDLDAFNYVISGTAKTDVRISWNSQFVTLSPWSLNLFDEADLQKGDNYIQISVGEAGTSYTLQFYRANGIPENETGAMVNGYVSFWEITEK